MPSAWNLIDTSFPAFTGKERVRDQIPVILNYMYMLSEGLKYQLNNLNNDNWNSQALENLKFETTADLVKQMASVVDQLSGILSRLDSISARILQAEMEIGNAEKELEEITQALSELEERLATVEGILLAIDEVVQTDGEGGAAIGGPGKTIHLNGTIYVNGKLLTVKEE